MNTTESENMPELSSSPTRITRRTFVKRTSASAIATVLALHAFQVEALAANQPASYILSLQNIQNYGAAPMGGIWDETAAIFIQTANFSGTSSINAPVVRSYTLYAALQIRPNKKKDDKRHVWSFIGTIVGAYIWADESQTEAKLYGGTNQPTVSMTAKLNGTDTVWTPTTQPNPDTASADGFTLTIRAVDKGFNITAEFMGTVQYTLVSNVTVNGTTTQVTEQVTLTPGGKLSATENVTIDLARVEN